MGKEDAVRTREWRGWTLHECASLVSTNDHARSLPAWHAIRAHAQTGGRGRQGRRWESGHGGLWMSAILPLDPPDRGWPAFPLAAGLAVVTTLRGLGLKNARLRWPNDVLVGARKICGILMEKFAADRVVVGIGLNVTNDPAEQDASLRDIATSLSSELPGIPPSGELYENILIALRAVHGRVAEEGFGSLADEINAHWGGTREVELKLADESVRGSFLGIDSRGDLLLGIDGNTSAYSAPRVQLMREV